MKGKKRLIALLLSAALLVTGCGASDDKKPEDTQKPGTENSAGIPADQIKVGFVFIGEPGDFGYTFAQNQGRLQLEKELGVKTVYVENVPESADCETAMRNMIDDGCNVIIATSFGYMDYVEALSHEFPDVYFMHCSGYKTTKNMSSYFGRIEQMRYLAGIVAGMKTETNKIGYVAAMTIPECVRGANAFALGVKSVNPDAVVEIKWTNTWYDPTAEKAAAISLLDNGCDVIAQHQDTTAPQVAAEERGAFAIGYNSSTAFAAPGAYLTAPIWNWGSYFVQEVQKIIDGTWESSAFWGGWETGVVALDDLTELVAPGTEEAVDAAFEKIKNGFNVFSGPIYDNQGNLRIKEGEAASDEEQLNMMWLVDNIIGSVEG